MTAIVTSLIFYMQMWVEKNPKAFAYRNYRHFTQQCDWSGKLAAFNILD